MFQTLAFLALDQPEYIESTVHLIHGCKISICNQSVLIGLVVIINSFVLGLKSTILAAFLFVPQCFWLLRCGAGYGIIAESRFPPKD